MRQGIVLSNAEVTEQDLYMLYIDFSSAFNTIDHDILHLGWHDSKLQEMWNDRHALPPEIRN